MTTVFASGQIVIIGGGPGGYEAALVAAAQGAPVILIEDSTAPGSSGSQAGVGGSAVLTDVVPSKTLIAAADVMSRTVDVSTLGIRVNQSADVDFKVLNQRVRDLAKKQSDDIHNRLTEQKVQIIHGRGKLLGPQLVQATHHDGTVEEIEASTILLAVGARPRELAEAQPDGERILTWKQLYELEEKPAKLIVVGSGVTGAEFASAYDALGSEVVLVSSRDRVLPGEDADAAEVLEAVFKRLGITVMGQSRAKAAARTEDGVVVTLEDGRTVEGSHALVAVGAIPNTQDLGCEEVGIQLKESGHIQVDRVSRTSVPGIYAAGDCTGVFALASVAATQGRTAMSHALGDAVMPLELSTVASTIFTSPEIATVGVTEAQIAEGTWKASTKTLDLTRNPRAKMQGITEGFVKIFASPGSGRVLGGVVVGPRASELIYPIALAVKHHLTVDEVAEVSTIYPSLAGSISEVARRHHKVRRPN